MEAGDNAIQIQYIAGSPRIPQTRIEF